MIPKIVAAMVLTMGIASAASAQSAAAVCESNIENIRKDLISMLNKIPAMPPLSQVYTAARERFEDVKSMRDRGQFQECAVEAERVARITRPYGNRN